MYKFYIFNEGNPPSGPFSATEIKEMELEKGTLVSELTIEEIDIEYFSREELEEQGIYTKTENTSGQIVEEPDEANEQPTEKSDEKCPSIIDKWNWGAFALPAIWGLFNGVYWPAIASVIASFAERFTRSNENMVIVRYSIFAILLIIRIILGVNGNKMAWKSAMKHISIEKFEKEQKTYNILGIAGLATIALVVILLYAFF